MGLLSKINPWAVPASQVVLVTAPSSLSERIARHLKATGITCDVSPSIHRAKRQIVHFLDLQEALNSPLEQLASANQIVVSVNSQDLENKEGLRRLHSLNSIHIVADGRATAQQFVDPNEPNPTVIYEGITPADFPAVRINQRLAIRRKLGVPNDGVCVGVFAQLDDRGQTLLSNTLEELRRKIGPVCFLGIKSDSIHDRDLDRRLRVAGIPAIRRKPKLLDDLLNCYGALDLYLNLSDTGDLRGILRSWAMGVPVVSTPNVMAAELLRDGLTAAVSECSTGVSLAEVASELHGDEEFRHGCCQRARKELEQFSWPNILAEYQEFYSQLRQSNPQGRAA